MKQMKINVWEEGREGEMEERRERRGEERREERIGGATLTLPHARLRGRPPSGGPQTQRPPPRPALTFHHQGDGRRDDQPGDDGPLQGGQPGLGLAWCEWEGKEGARRGERGRDT